VEDVRCVCVERKMTFVALHLCNDDFIREAERVETSTSIIGETLSMKNCLRIRNVLA
jgi:hypothetical protein